MADRTTTGELKALLRLWEDELRRGEVMIVRAAPKPSNCWRVEFCTAPEPRAEGGAHAE